MRVRQGNPLEHSREACDPVFDMFKSKVEWLCNGSLFVHPAARVTCRLARSQTEGTLVLIEALVVLTTSLVAEELSLMHPCRLDINGRNGFDRICLKEDGPKLLVNCFHPKGSMQKDSASRPFVCSFQGL